MGEEPTPKLRMTSEDMNVIIESLEFRMRRLRRSRSWAKNDHEINQIEAAYQRVRNTHYKLRIARRDARNRT